MINAVVEVNAEINTWYRTSKLPKFIKVAVCKSKRRKLHKLCYKYSQLPFYSYNDIYQLFHYCSATYEPMGQKSYIDHISILMLTTLPSGERITGNLKYKLKDEDTLFDIDINLIRNRNDSHWMDINVTLRRDGSSYTEHVENIQTTEPKDNQTEFIHDCLCGINRMLNEIYLDVACDIIDNSERIYEEKT